MSKKKKKINGFSCTINLVDGFEKLRKVHKSIPEFNFDCTGCKKNCCVSPYISVIEFLYVSSHILRSFDEPYKILLNDNGRNEYGFKVCPFLDKNKRCLIYKVRHYKCRMTGMDILDKLFTDVCEHKVEKSLKSPEITKEKWLEWIAILTKINKPFDYSEQLFFDEWLTFYFKGDDELNKKEIRVRDFMRNYLRLENYIPKLSVDDLI